MVSAARRLSSADSFTLVASASSVNSTAVKNGRDPLPDSHNRNPLKAATHEGFAGAFDDGAWSLNTV